MFSATRRFPRRRRLRRHGRRPRGLRYRTRRRCAGSHTQPTRHRKTAQLHESAADARHTVHPHPHCAVVFVGIRPTPLGICSHRVASSTLAVPLLSIIPLRAIRRMRTPQPVALWPPCPLLRSGICCHQASEPPEPTREDQSRRTERRLGSGPVLPRTVRRVSGAPQPVDRSNRRRQHFCRRPIAIQVHDSIAWRERLRISIGITQAPLKRLIIVEF